MGNRCLVIGNSHTRALDAAVEASDGFRVEWLKAKVDSQFGTLSLDAAKEMISRLDAADVLVLMHLGALHNIMGLLNSSVPFSFSDMEEPPADRYIMPREVVRADMRETVSRDSVLPAFAALSPCRVFHCMTPPPKKAPPIPEKDSKAYRGISIRQVGYAPAAVRREMWRIESGVVAEHCEKIGITPLAPPEAAFCEQGFLRAEYCANDATHANAAYGSILKTQIAGLLAA